MGENTEYSGITMDENETPENDDKAFEKITGEHYVSPMSEMLMMSHEVYEELLAVGFGETVSAAITAHLIGTGLANLDEFGSGASIALEMGEEDEDF